MNAATTAMAPGAPIDVPSGIPQLEGIENTHTRIQFEQDSDPSQNFSVVLPQAWSRRPDPTGTVKQPLFDGRMLVFFAPAGAPTEIPVVFALLTRATAEIPLDTWARLAYERDDHTIVTSRWFNGPKGLFFDITGRHTENGAEVVRRTSLRQDGDRIFALHTSCRIESWNTHKDNFWIAHLTFGLLNAKGGEIEAQNTAIAKSPVFRVEFPASWEARPIASGLRLQTAGAGKASGAPSLEIRAERGQQAAIDAQLQAAVALLQKAQISPRGEPRALTSAEDPRSKGVEGWQATYELPARKGATELAVRLGFLRREELNFSFVSYSPTHEADLLAALRAQRVFEIARDGLALPVK